ncbi:nucleotide pyrophosphohydrolase [Streptomyces termitum]|uniref:nucleotide pyrophosphohydrolase n=1 Tax=Streptomyces termitum TaxID=67368 RepID=UPI0037AF61E6
MTDHDQHPTPTPTPGPAPDVAGLQRRLADFAAARRWEPYHTPKNLAAALSVEAAELLEIFQWSTPEEAARVMDDPASAHRVTDEVADVLAYLLQFCQVLGVDPLAALDAKIDRNELRFPAPKRPGTPGETSPGESAPDDRHSSE